MSARYDLHVHSTASDGLRAPAEVAAHAARCGLAGFALTDHDTTAGCSAAMDAAAELGIRCIAGIEVSCSSPEAGEVHLLGYFVEPDDAVLLELVERQQRSRTERALDIVARVRELTGSQLTIDDVLRESGGIPPGRPHIARAMVAAGILREVGDAFGPDWLAYGGRAYVRRATADVAEAIAVVHGAGGVAVFAHPGSRSQRDVIREAAVRHAARHGLDGIEVDHPDHVEVARQRCASLAVELDLVPTAGSDDHGTPAHGSGMGSETVPASVVEMLEQRARSRRP